MPGQHGADTGFRNLLDGLDDGGNDGLLIPEHADAIEADDLHILRNADVPGAKETNDLPGQGVRADKKPIEGELAASDMRTEKALNFREGLAVIQGHGLKGQAQFYTGADKTILPLAGLIGEVGGDPQEGHVGAAKFPELMGSQPAATEMVRVGL